MSVDLGTVVLLAIVVWLDGWRRLSTDALLVARSGFGPWDVRTPWARAGPFALVTWWAPIVVPLLLSPVSPAASNGQPARMRWKDDFDVAVARDRRRLHRVRWLALALRALGVLLILWIIVGIPVATTRFGGPGLIHGVLGALVIAIATTFFTTVALRSLGVPLRRSLRTTAQLLSPFTAPRAAEIVTGAAIGPLHSLAPLVALLGEARFLAWVRPWAYDELAGRHQPNDEVSATVASLVRALPRRMLERAVAPAIHGADHDGTRYCPRCARTYREAAERCADCSDLALVAIARPR